jgi:hypothetical protein
LKILSKLVNVDVGKIKMEDWDYDWKR